MPQPHARGHAALRRHRYSLPGNVYHVTSATEARRPVLVGAAAFAVARCFGTPALWGDASALAWVVMPDHAHWLVQLGDRDSLPVVMNRIKSASARSARIAGVPLGRVWGPGYYERRLRGEHDLQNVAAYIIANPVRARLAEHIGDYPFWDSAYP